MSRKTNLLAQGSSRSIPLSEVIWDIVVYVDLGRVLDPIHPTEMEFRSEYLASGAVTTKPILQLKTDPSIWMTLGQLYFPNDQIEVDVSKGLFADLLQAFLPLKDLETAIKECFAPLVGEVASITPRMSLGGEILPAEVLPGLDGFHVDLVVRPHRNSAVLSLCIDTSLAPKGGGLGLVIPFVGDSQFGYFFSEKIAQSVVENRYNRSSTVKSFINETKVPLQDPENESKTVNGKALVEWKWTKAPSTQIALSPGTNGALRLKSVGTLTVLKMWNHESEKVEKEDYPELFEPVERGLNIDAALFDEDLSEAAEPVALHTAKLLDPIYRPTMDKLYVNVESGLISGAVNGVILCGELTHEGV